MLVYIIIIFGLSQGIVKLSQARNDKLKRVSLRVDEADITFALKVNKTPFVLFQNYLQTLFVHKLQFLNSYTLLFLIA